MPGVFLFRMAGGMVDLVTLGPHASPALLVQVVADGTTALLIILAMSCGLILPKMGIQSFTQSLFHRRRQKFVGGLKSPFVAGKFGKGETL
jgi:hypothetical protein